MEIIHKYFPDLTPLQIARLTELENIYTRWNQKINLLSRKDIPFLYERHILHSLSIGKYFHFSGDTRILDVGTGGGFPGIPLAILFDETHFLLADSIGKKILAVNDIIHQLELKNCTAIQARAETIPEKFDFIVSRAVTNFRDFIKLTSGKIRPGKKINYPNGIIYLKGGYFEDEIRSVKNAVSIISLSDLFEEEFFLTKKIIYLKI